MYEDIIKFETDIKLYDKEGNEITIEQIEPEYLPEIFSLIDGNK